MKRIGMLGGMSWESSALYYELVNEAVVRRLGGFHSARVILGSVDFADIESLQASGDWDAAGALLADEAHRLELAGAELLVLCTNTMHKVADRITRDLGIPLIHLAEVTADAVLAADLTSVGLLGTRFTVDEPFYRERLESRGLRVLLPSADDRAIVNSIIYDELVLGIVREESRDEYRRVIDRLGVDGAQGVILGCTEIELLIEQVHVPLPVFPTTRLHAEAAVEAALAE
jgi:aspartate racemase